MENYMLQNRKLHFKLFFSFLFSFVSEMHAKYALALILALQGKATHQCNLNNCNVWI